MSPPMGRANGPKVAWSFTFNTGKQIAPVHSAWQNVLYLLQKLSITQSMDIKIFTPPPRLVCQRNFYRVRRTEREKDVCGRTPSFHRLHTAFCFYLTVLKRNNLRKWEKRLSKNSEPSAAPRIKWLPVKEAAESFDKLVSLWFIVSEIITIKPQKKKKKKENSPSRLQANRRLHSWNLTFFPQER